MSSPQDGPPTYLRGGAGLLVGLEEGQGVHTAMRQLRAQARTR